MSYRVKHDSGLHNCTTSSIQAVRTESRSKRQIGSLFITIYSVYKCLARLASERTPSRIQSGWNNWKRVSGILCDRRISLIVKGKVYKTVVRPGMMYGAETWAMKKAQEKKLDVAELRMLRWMSGVTKLDRIRNERIRGTTKVG